ncbi:permease prefix domain 1-containing protein [Evansella clarkii]|uniref:permease prefix domain 1-containing protein n=1 Tax=Evansella clarkii TaxID=79879 RepID=UPI000997FD4A|nr:permease prefix domain 1-containing protein [Evansella clarkii]
MKKVDEYINSIYKQAMGDKEEIEELKDETRNHLMKDIEELKSEGKLEKEAVQIAIERFGEENVKGSVAGKFYNTQKSFSKIVLVVGIAALIIAFVLSEVIALAGNSAKEADAEIHADVMSIIADQETITDEQKEVIDSMLAETQYTTAYRYYYINELEVGSFDRDLVMSYTDNKDPKYLYENKELLENTAFTEIGTTTVTEGNSHVVRETIINSPLSSVVILIGIVVYWILFAFWGLTTLYQRNNLKFGGGLLVVTLNVVGYILYLQWEKNMKEPA